MNKNSADVIHELLRAALYHIAAKPILDESEYHCNKNDMVKMVKYFLSTKLDDDKDKMFDLDKENFEISDLNDTTSHELKWIKYKGMNLVRINDICMLQTLVNKTILANFIKKKLHVVVGSLGMGKCKVPQFEYGEADGTVDLTCGQYHVWLEDHRGLVYDVITPTMVIASKMNNAYFNFMQDDVVFGLTKKALQKRGLHYVSAKSCDQVTAMKTIETYQEKAFEIAKASME